MDIITYLCWDKSLTMLIKGATSNKASYRFCEHRPRELGCLLHGDSTHIPWFTLLARRRYGFLGRNPDEYGWMNRVDTPMTVKMHQKSSHSRLALKLEYLGTNRWVPWLVIIWRRQVISSHGIVQINGKVKRNLVFAEVGFQTCSNLNIQKCWNLQTLCNTVSCVITRSNITWYCIKHNKNWGRTLFRMCTHKSHISCPRGPAMKCLCEDMGENYRAITAPYVISTW